MENIIQINSLTFSYSKELKVLDNISLNVPKGSIYGFLGPNGAGKSTTMGLITGLLPVEENTIKMFNEPLNNQLPEMFSRIGSIVESPSLYGHLTGKENLKYFAKLKSVTPERIDEVLEIVRLTQSGNRKAKEYSLGMKQRLAIALALLGKPDLLLLDEPVNGLDPAGIVEIRELLVRLNKEDGVTIFVSSHLLSEIEKMCTHIGIINQGKLKFEGTMKELSEQSSGYQIRVAIKGASRWVKELAQENMRLHNENEITVTLNNKSEVPDLIKMLVGKGIEIYEVKIIDGLEEWFIQLTKNN
jgi:ABC-2 type transport system ATP-binding protein